MNELATKNDLLLLEERIKGEIQKISMPNGPSGTDEIKHLRTRDVRRLLGISQNKLQEMRLKGQIPFIQVGATFFYPEKELAETLRKKSA